MVKKGRLFFLFSLICLMIIPEVIGDPDDDLMVLLGKLIEKCGETF